MINHDLINWLTFDSPWLTIKFGSTKFSDKATSWFLMEVTFNGFPQEMVLESAG